MIFDVCEGRGCAECSLPPFFLRSWCGKDGMRNRYVNDSETRCKSRRVWSRSVLVGLS